MASQATCCDCRYYEPLPSGPSDKGDGRCTVKKIKVYWYNMPCNRFRLEPLERTVETIAYHTGALKRGMTWRIS